MSPLVLFTAMAFAKAPEPSLDLLLLDVAPTFTTRPTISETQWATMNTTAAAISTSTILYKQPRYIDLLQYEADIADATAKYEKGIRRLDEARKNLFAPSDTGVKYVRDTEAAYALEEDTIDLMTLVRVIDTATPDMLATRDFGLEARRSSLQARFDTAFSESFEGRSTSAQNLMTELENSRLFLVSTIQSLKAGAAESARLRLEFRGVESLAISSFASNSTDTEICLIDQQLLVVGDTALPAQIPGQGLFWCIEPHSTEVIGFLVRDTSGQADQTFKDSQGDYARLYDTVLDSDLIAISTGSGRTSLQFTKATLSDTALPSSDRVLLLRTLNGMGQ